MTDDMTPEQAIPPARKVGLVKRCLLFLLFATIGAGGYLAYDAYTFATRPAAAEAREVTIDIEPGATFDRVAWDLYKLGALKDVFRFRIMAKLQNKLGAIQAGEFTVNTGWTPRQLLTHLTSGKPNLYRLAIREGLPWWEVAQLVEEGGFATAAAFEAVIHDPAFLRRYGIPFANAEGFLYPETYLLRKPREIGGRAQAEVVARILVDMFWKRTEAILPRPPATDAAGTEDLRYRLILASLVEKETGVPEERARVAGVYANRMRLGMLLQCDPTIIYGLGKNQSGPIRKSQLENEKNPYNTYKHPGLPPGPICSPGAASILAAVNPGKHNFLYFVATGKPDGTHTFSTTLRDHERAVAAYRATQK